MDIVGTKTSFIVLPGSIAMKDLTVDEPTEIFRDGGAYNGGGSTEIWHRWGYVLAPAGYNWAGSQEEFPSDAKYQGVLESGTPGTLAGVATIGDASGVWTRKSFSALTLGILPVFHS